MGDLDNTEKPDLKYDVEWDEDKLHNIPLEKILRIEGSHKQSVEHIKERLCWKVLDVQNYLAGNLRRRLKRK